MARRPALSPPLTNDDPLQAWRRQTVQMLFRILLVTLPVIMGIDALNHIRYGRWYLVPINIALTLLVIGFGLARRLDLRVRAASLVGILILGGALGVRFLGLYGVNPSQLIAAVVLAALLLGPRASVLTGVVGALTLAGLFAGFTSGLLPYPYDPIAHVTEPRVLANNWVLICSLGALLGVMVSSLVTTLQSSLGTTRTTMQELARLNASLEASVAERTAELQHAMALLEATQRVARVGGGVFDPATSAVEWSHVLRELHGIPDGVDVGPDLLGRLYPGESGRMIMETLRGMAEGDPPREIEVPAATLDGRPRWIRMTAVADTSEGSLRYIGAMQDITPQKQAEQRIVEQLRFAQALAKCTRVLLAAPTSEEGFRHIVASALETVREVVGGDRVALARYPEVSAGEGAMLHGYRVLATADGPGMPEQRPITTDEIRDMPLQLNVWRRGGGSYNGPVADVTAGHPAYARYCEENGLRSVFIQALEASGGWWGHITITDHREPRRWGGPAVQFIQTAAEMIVTFCEAWDVTRRLQEREALLRSLSDNVPSSFLFQVVWSPTRGFEKFTYISQSVERLFGHSPARILDQPDVLLGAIHSDDAGLVTDVTFAGDAHEPRTVEARLVKADGTPGWFEMRAIPARDLGDGRSLWNGVALEITDRKQAEFALGRQLRYAEALATCSRILLSEESGVVEWEVAVRQVLRVLREVTGLSRASLYLYQEAGELIGLPSMVVADDAPGRPPYITTAVKITDIPTPLMEEVARGGWFAGDTDALFAPGSSSAEALLINGLRSVSFTGLVVGGLWRGYLSASHELPGWVWDEPLIQLLRTGLEMIGLRLQQWETMGLLRTREAVLHDTITAQRELQESLARARDEAQAAAQARATFLATMSHEIRTPLNAVIGMATLLRGTELSGEQHRFVDTIVGGGQALLTVISNILDFSRIESGRLDLEAQPFDLHACLTSSVDLVAHQAQQKGLDVACRVDGSLPRAVVGDEGRLRQVLLNLLANAVKFTDRGSVALEARAATLPDGRADVTIAVRDTGIGIEEGRLDQVFEPFVQADSSTARRYGGTGLGLPIVRQLVALMGGQIDVASRPGAGSTFTVHLPMPVAEAAARPAAPEPEEAGRPLRVLIAEDNPINQEVTRRLVSAMGHAVVVVGDGRAAVDAVSQAAFDVVIMDAQMPELDGEGATREIRLLGEAVHQPHIIALTAEALLGDRERFLRLGMDDYLSKPVDPAALRGMLARVRAGRERA